jgi:hypothetical protein
MPLSNATHAIIIDWYGPFDNADEASVWVRSNSDLVPGHNSTSPALSDARRPSGMYLATGTLSLRNLRHPWLWLIQSSRVRYVGIGNVQQRLKRRSHPIRAYMGRVDQIWVGSLGTYPSREDAPQIGDPCHDSQIELAEALLAYFLESSLNKSKRRNQTPEPGVLVNRWFSVEGGLTPQPFAASPHPSVPDILIWPYDGPRAVVRQFAAPSPSLPPMMPSWLNPTSAKAAALRFRRGLTGLRVTMRLIDALKVAQLDRNLLRKKERKKGR